MTDEYYTIAAQVYDGMVEIWGASDDGVASNTADIANALRSAADKARAEAQEQAFADALALATNRRDNFTLMGAKPAAVAGADEVCVFLAAELQRVRDGEHIPGRPGSKSYVTDCAAPPTPDHDDAPLTLPVVGKAIVTTLPIDPEANKSPAGPGLTEAQIEEMVADANSFGARVGTLEKYVRIFAAEVRRLRTCVEETLAEHDDDLVSLHAARADIEQLRAANEGIPAMRDKIEAQRAKIKEACRERDQLRATVDQLTRERDEAREEAERQKFIADRVLQARREDIGMEITDNCLCGGSAKEAQQCPVHR